MKFHRCNSYASYIVLTVICMCCYYIRKIECTVSWCVSGRQIPPLDPHENGNNGAIKLGKQTSQTGRRCCWPNLIFLDLLEKQHRLLFSLRKDFMISVMWLLILKAVISILPMINNARTRSRKLYFKGILQNLVGKSSLVSCQNYNVKVLQFSV